MAEISTPQEVTVYSSYVAEALRGIQGLQSYATPLPISSSVDKFAQVEIPNKQPIIAHHMQHGFPLYANPTDADNTQGDIDQRPMSRVVDPPIEAPTTLIKTGPILVDDDMTQKLGYEYMPAMMMDVMAEFQDQYQECMLDGLCVKPKTSRTAMSFRDAVAIPSAAAAVAARPNRHGSTVAKFVTYNSIVDMREELINKNLLKSQNEAGFVLLVDARQASQIYRMEEWKRAGDFRLLSPSGVATADLDTILSFQLIVRSKTISTLGGTTASKNKTITYVSADTPSNKFGVGARIQSPTGSGATTARSGSCIVAFSPRFIGSAYGQLRNYTAKSFPTTFSDIFSFKQKVCFTPLYADGTGIHIYSDVIL